MATTISRRLPQSVDARSEALSRAKQKRDSLPAANDVLRAATRTELDALQPLYQAAVTSVNNSKASLGNTTATKNTAGRWIRMFISHFLQVFNLGVDREEYPKGDRAYYGLNIDAPTVPEMGTDQSVITEYNKVLIGESQRTAAGGVPMANPDMATLSARFTPFEIALVLQSNLKDTLDTAQEALDEKYVQSDSLIRKIWDEVESKYADEPKESLRDNAREWGVVYVSLSSTATEITVIVNAINLPQQGAFVRLIASDMEGVTDANGTIIFSTKVVGDETVRVFLTGKPPLDTNISIVEGTPQTVLVEF